MLFGWHSNCVSSSFFYDYWRGGLMGLDEAMDKAWPKIRRKIKSGKAGTSPEERELVIQARTFLCLYLFEHQYVHLIS